MPKQTPIQKAIAYCPEECTAMREYLQSLLAEEREQKKDDWADGVYGNSASFDDYFTQTYES